MKMKNRCRDGVTCVVLLCPLLPAHCHQFVWFLALPSLHPLTHLENVFHGCANVVVSCSSYPCRLYRNLTLEIIIATALGHYIDIQNGEADALVEAACDTIAFLEVEKFPSVPELLLIFCKFEVPVYLLSTKCVRTLGATYFMMPFPLQLTSL